MGFVLVVVNTSTPLSRELGNARAALDSTESFLLTKAEEQGKQGLVPQIDLASCTRCQEDSRGFISVALCPELKQSACREPAKGRTEPASYLTYLESGGFRLCVVDIPEDTYLSLLLSIRRTFTKSLSKERKASNGAGGLGRSGSCSPGSQEGLWQGNANTQTEPGAALSPGSPTACGRH